MGHLNNIIKSKDAFIFFDIKNFVETGTGIGTTLRKVIEDKPELLNIYTIELMDELYNNLIEEFGSFSFVNLIKGLSKEELEKLMKVLSPEPTMFWLDAHFPGADFGINNLNYFSESNPEINTPLESELKEIVKSKRDISKDIFIIDDLRIYKDGPYSNGNWEPRKIIGGDGIEFIFNLFEKTHHIVESYKDEGYILLFPNIYQVEDCKKIIFE